MPLLHSEAEAALLEAGALSHRLAERYRLAAERLADQETAGDRAQTHTRLHQRFSDNAQATARQAQALDEAARSLGLLPRESETELEALKQLADQIQGLVDDDQAHALSQRFAEDEQTLLEELEQAAQLDPRPQILAACLAASRDRIEQL